MDDISWDEYRDTEIHLHAVRTKGRDHFANVVLCMMHNGITVTHESFDKEINLLMTMARDRNNRAEYLQFMLAHAFVSYMTHMRENSTEDV